MVFVPRTTSARAQMLAGDLARSIEEFRARCPEATARDVQQGLMLAAASERRLDRYRGLWLVLALAIAVGAGAVLLWMVSAAGAGVAAQTVALLVPLIAIAVVGIALAVSRIG